MIRTFSQWVVALLACASWTGSAVALTLDRPDGLGFGGGGNTIPLGSNDTSPTFEPFVQSCDGLRFSATDQICPMGSFIGPGNTLTNSGLGSGIFLNPTDADIFYTPITQSCDGLRFSGTDQVCGFSSIGGLGGGVDLTADGGLGDPYPVTQSCDGLRFSGTDQICAFGDGGIARSGTSSAGNEPPGGSGGSPEDPSSGGSTIAAPGPNDPVGQVNAPATLALFGLGLVALGVSRRRRQRGLGA